MKCAEHMSKRASIFQTSRKSRKKYFFSENTSSIWFLSVLIQQNASLHCYFLGTFRQRAAQAASGVKVPWLEAHTIAGSGGRTATSGVAWPTCRTGGGTEREDAGCEGGSHSAWAWARDGCGGPRGGRLVQAPPGVPFKFQFFHLQTLSGAFFLKKLKKPFFCLFFLTAGV